jgi:hypothetical protein
MPEMLTKEAKNTQCRFSMFVRVKESSTFRFKKFDDPLVGWFRGDKYYKEDVGKMLGYLLGIIKNHQKQYAVMELHDTAIPKTDPDRIVLKINQGDVKVNRLPDYDNLLGNQILPEWLSYEVKP